MQTKPEKDGSLASFRFKDVLVETFNEKEIIVKHRGQLEVKGQPTEG